ncbi:MAG: aminoacyl-tRNA hydrolase [Candidatus Omnitrophica bacterium]|nr:aminoacyl-tRNA hydrolase [Candidatus Omnitrophota bacterium]
MKLIVGLCNPGKEYEHTRHNVGKLALDKLAKKISATQKHEVVLAIPGTFMNLSGPAVLNLIRKHKVASPRDVLILVDDLHLPVGKIRFRPEGSSGGHNGLASVIDAFNGDQSFPRLRIGIGKPEEEVKPWKEHVLEKFTKEERTVLNQALEKAADCALSWLTEPAEALMQKFN